MKRFYQKKIGRRDFYRRFRQRTDQPQAETERTEIHFEGASVAPCEEMTKDE
jgi:hypothetical protein